MHIKSDKKVKRADDWISLADATAAALSSCATNVVNLAVERDARMKDKTPHYRDHAEYHYVHEAFHRYFGRGAPRRNRRRMAPSYGEVCITVFNEWTGVPFTPDVIDAWARELNWQTPAFAEFIREMERDGIFEMAHPEKGVRS